MGDFLTVVSLVAFVVMTVLAIRLMRQSVTATRRAVRWVIGSGLTWVGAFLVSIAVGGTEPGPVIVGPDGQPQMSVAGYEQTWPKGYTRTTCQEFAEDMSSSQQFAAAADMLTLVWMKIEDTTLYPNDSLIQQYRDAVESRCDVPSESIAQVAWGVWITDPRFAAA